MSLASPAAAHSGAAAGAIMVLFFSAIFALAVFIIVVIICGIKRYSGLKIIGISLLFGIITFIGTVFIWFKLIQNENRITKEKAQSAVEDQRDAEQSWRNSPLKEAACNADLTKLRATLSSRHFNRRNLRRAFEDCAVEQANAEVADLLLDNIMRPEVTQEKTAHCSYLAPVFRQIGKNINLEVLALFARRKLSLDCREGVREIPTWWSETQQQNNAISDPNFSKFLSYLASQGVDLYADLGGRNLLSYAMEFGDAATIAVVLNERSKPYALLPNSDSWTALQYWILRRHGYQRQPQLSGAGAIPELSDQERANIQAQLRELAPDEANFFNGVGQRFTAWGDFPDGGAALFRYLRQRGAKLHIPNQYGVGIFHGRTTFSPALIAELDQLTDTELRELSCPIDNTGTVKLPLYAEAKVHQNHSITDYLDKRRLNSAC
ncbi:hypothetical protein [Undibacterium sp. Di24W]|uniref:hypothetical protein n=1 Tax=Undibacterium sp. Di24W TaxID=3413033 RepID=UPI003BEF66C1